MSKEALLAAIAKTPAPTRREARRRAWIALTVGGVLGVALFAKIGMHAGPRPLLFVIVCALGLAALAVRSSMLAIVALCAIAANYALTGEPVQHPPHDLACAAITGLFSLIFGASFLVAFKSTDPIHPARRGIQLATTATTLAAMFVFLICECDQARHFFIAHIAAAIAAGALLAVVGRRVVAVR